MGRLRCLELIPDIEKFLPVVIFQMVATILHKFNIVRFQRPELISDIEKFLPVSIFKMVTTILQKIQHCSISKVVFNLFFKAVVSGRFGRLHNRQIIIISSYYVPQTKFGRHIVFAPFLIIILIIIIPSQTKLRRDIVALPSVRPSFLPSFRNILVNTLGSTSFNGF